MFATTVGRPPYKRKALTVGAAGPITKLHSNSIDNDSTATLRLQFVSRHGVRYDRARLIAALLFGEVA